MDTYSRGFTGGYDVDHSVRTQWFPQWLTAEKKYFQKCSTAPLILSLWFVPCGTLASNFSWADLLISVTEPLLIVKGCVLSVIYIRRFYYRSKSWVSPLQLCHIHLKQKKAHISTMSRLHFKYTADNQTQCWKLVLVLFPLHHTVAVLYVSV